MLFIYNDVDAVMSNMTLYGLYMIVQDMIVMFVESWRRHGVHCELMIENYSAYKNHKSQKIIFLWLNFMRI